MTYNKKTEEWRQATIKAHELDTWRRQAVPGEWPIIQQLANRILEEGMKRDFMLMQERIKKRKQNIRQKLLRERRENEEQKLALKNAGVNLE